MGRASSPSSALPGGTMKPAANYNLVIIEPTSGHVETQQRVSFASLGVKERQHIEQWLIDHPEILGERLLVITKEFAEFEQSQKRLDILALDENKKLVVLELKRDASGSLAELQAIRYAAMCSTMTFDKLVDLYAKFSRRGVEEAKTRIREFVHDEEFSVVDDRPRIILVAGAFEDQHLTSTVLWLGKFGIDITCVELTPYQLPGSKKLAIVPRVIIPLPQAIEYLIQVKEKELAESSLSRSAQVWRERNQQILNCFRELMPDKTPPSASPRNIMQIHTGVAGLHFEWGYFVREKVLIVGIHFESSSKHTNQQRYERFRKQRAKLERAVGGKLEFNPHWRDSWASISLKKSCAQWSDEMAQWAATKMVGLIRVAQPIIDDLRS
jgi:hypothetical protein